MHFTRERKCSRGNRESIINPVIYRAGGPGTSIFFYCWRADRELTPASCVVLPAAVLVSVLLVSLFVRRWLVEAVGGSKYDKRPNTGV